MKYKLLGDRLAIAAFSLPALLLFTVFTFASTVRSAVGSVFDWDGITAGTFVGFKQYFKLFGQEVFYVSLWNGLVAVAVMLVVQLFFGLFFALVLAEREIRFKKLFRISFFLPVVISVSTACILGISVLRSQGGMLNNFLRLFGLSQSWLSDTRGAIVAISAINAWQFMGFFLSVLYAGLKSIPEHYTEAAVLDGASKLQIYALVTIPLLGEVIKFSTIFAVLGGLNQFAHNMMVSAGGPGFATYSITLLMYYRGFGTSDYGYGCAIAVIIVVQALLAYMIINRLIARERISY